MLHLLDVMERADHCDLTMNISDGRQQLYRDTPVTSNVKHFKPAQDQFLKSASCTCMCAGNWACTGRMNTFTVDLKCLNGHQFIVFAFHYSAVTFCLLS